MSHITKKELRELQLSRSLQGLEDLLAKLALHGEIVVIDEKPEALEEPVEVVLEPFVEDPGYEPPAPIA